MLAAIFEGPERMFVREVDRPQCSEDGLVLRVEACAICGTDIRIYHHGQRNVKIPQIMGHEISGIVDEVGPLTTDFKVGDRVAVSPGVPCGKCKGCLSGNQNFCTAWSKGEGIGFGYSHPGGFAQYMHIPSRALRAGTVIPVPDHADLDEVSIFEPLGCVVNAQEMVKPTVGDTVVVVGAGPIGCMHVALAKLLGADKTILIDLLPSRLELASRFAPSVYVNSSEEDPVKRVMEETDGAGADVVIVACSAHKPQEQAMEMAVKGGRVSFFAGLPHDQPYVTLNSNLLHYKQLALYGVAGANARQHKAAFDMLVNKRIDGADLVTHRFPVTEILEAFQVVESGQSLKTIIKPNMPA